MIYCPFCNSSIYPRKDKSNIKLSCRNHTSPIIFSSCLTDVNKLYCCYYSNDDFYYAVYFEKKFTEIYKNLHCNGYSWQKIFYLDSILLVDPEELEKKLPLLTCLQ